MSAIDDLLKEFAFEIIRPEKDEHIKIYANGKVEITPISTNVRNSGAKIIVNNCIPSLLREAMSEGKYG